MAINIADNMGYNGKKPLDGRTEYATLAAMKAVADANINEGCLAYNKEDGKYYKFLSTNTVDVTTGKWREFSTGGGQTYNDFTGATASTAGAHGLVPAPSAGDEGKVLFGNGLWGTLPSVDLSVLSNEANIYSTTEKVIGQWTDGKLLYQKSVLVSLASSSTWTDTPHGISNIDFAQIVSVSIDKYTVGSIVPAVSQSIIAHVGASNIEIYNSLSGLYGKSGYVTVQYTKTTDGPLPSDEKFAGVTASGEVIYERTVTGLSISLNWSGDKFASASFSPLFSGVDSFIGMTAYDADGCHTGSMLKDGNNWEIRALVGATITGLTIRYTKSSS